MDNSKNDIPRITPKPIADDPARYFGKRKVIKKAPLPARVAIALVSAWLLLLAIQGVVMAINGFFEVYRINTHPIIELKVQWPFELQKKATPKPTSFIFETIETVHASDATPSATPTPKPTPAPNIAKIVDFIWYRETGRGSATFGWAVQCASKGKWNEIGYGGPDFCFDSKEQGMATLTKEITERVAKNGVLETLCVYNLGYLKDKAGVRIKYTDCSYYQDYLKTL